MPALDGRDMLIMPIPGAVRVNVTGLLYEKPLTGKELLGLAIRFAKAAEETLRAEQPQ